MQFRLFLIFWLLWKMVLQTFVSKTYMGKCFHFSWVNTFWGLFSMEETHLAFSLVAYEGSNFSTSSPKLVIIFFTKVILMGLKCYLIWVLIISIIANDVGHLFIKAYLMLLLLWSYLYLSFYYLFFIYIMCFVSLFFLSFLLNIFLVYHFNCSVYL